MIYCFLALKLLHAYCSIFMHAVLNAFLLWMLTLTSEKDKYRLFVGPHDFYCKQQ